MVGHRHAKLDDDRQCGSGDIMLLVAEGEDPIYCLSLTEAHGLKAHDISC